MESFPVWPPHDLWLQEAQQWRRTASERPAGGAHLHHTSCFKTYSGLKQEAERRGHQSEPFINMFGLRCRGSGSGPVYRSSRTDTCCSSQNDSTSQQALRPNWTSSGSQCVKFSASFHFCLFFGTFTTFIIMFSDDDYKQPDVLYTGIFSYSRFSLYG